MQEKERHFPLDLYRIVCMFLITTTHILGYSQLIRYIPQTHLNFVLVTCLQTLQTFSLSGFTLISAYFLVDQTTTLRKAVAFVLQVFFFSVTILVLALCFGFSELSAKLLVKSIFPILSNHYWYPVNYLILLLFAPLLNRVIHSAPRKELRAAILLLGAVVSLFFHVDPFYDPSLLIGHGSQSLLWFFLLYLIAAYLRLYGGKRPLRTGLRLFVLSGTVLFALYLLQNRGFDTPFLQKLLQRVDLLANNSPLSLLFSVSAFLLFSGLRFSPPGWLSKAASCCVPAVFGIYLIQEHEAVRDALWALVDISRLAESLWLFPVLVGIFFLLWVIAMGLHLLYRLARRHLLGPLEERICRRIELLRKKFSIFFD